jgi:hypothetical protein
VQLRALGRPPAALAGDELPPARAERPDDDRLDHPARGDRGGQLVQRGIVEVPTRLFGVRLDRRDRQHRQTVGDRGRGSAFVRRLAIGDERLLTPGFAQQGAETAAQRERLALARRGRIHRNANDRIVAHAAFLFSGNRPINSRASAI